MDKSGLSEEDIHKLVKLVERRPEIWDKSCNKDTVEKRKAWIDIFHHFIEIDWDFISEAEKKKIEQELTGKWQNLRDTFIKAVKKRREQQYKHYESMKFLLKNFNSDPLPSPSEEEQPPVNETNKSPFFKRTKKTLRINLIKKRKRLPFVSKTVKGRTSALRLKALKLKTATTDVKPPATVTNDVAPPETIANNAMHPVTVTNNVIKSSEQHHNNIVIDPDESFFFSILSSVKRLSDADKLEFRMGVLQALRNVTNKS